MTELHSDAWELYISPNANGHANGSSSAPFPTLDAAVDELKRRLDEQKQKTTGFSPRRPLEIVCIQQPGAPFPPRKQPEHEYYVDPFATPVSADGSQLSPWPTLAAAVDSLALLRRDGKLDLKPGQRVRVTLHDVFTPTDVERAKNRNELIAKYVFLAMAMAAVVPVVLILGILITKAWPALSLSFLLENPKNGMTA
ncbi:MAG: hypothetical protein KDA42_09090, partial [Planctomycetales bacterium]|nr:hypothetical protein [Planctomycetales bacterium]